MIEIFEPRSPEYNRQRAEQELGAARAAHLMKARTAHLELAARHLSTRMGADHGRTGSGGDQIRVALQAAFLPPRDDEYAELLSKLH